MRWIDKEEGQDIKDVVYMVVVGSELLTHKGALLYNRIVTSGEQTREIFGVKRNEELLPSDRISCSMMTTIVQLIVCLMMCGKKGCFEICSFD